MKKITGTVNRTDQDKIEVVPPLHFSTICSQKIPGEVIGFEYGRIDNPTRTMVEKELASLENGREAILFSSGMAAINAILLTLKSGDHLICGENIYEGTKKLIEEVFSKFKLETSFVKNSSDLKKKIRKNTKLVLFETVSNPLLEIIDIEKVKKIIKDHSEGKCQLIIDNTLSTPFCLNPLKLGADIVIHSTTKFLAGHHDTIGGVAIINDKEIAHQIRNIQQMGGSFLAPFDCFLLSRGLKTFKVRFEKQSKNAELLAKWLSKHPKVKKVIFPGLKNHPQHKIAKKQMKNFGAMISIVIKGNNPNHFFRELKMIKIAKSFGGFGTTIQVPRKMMTFSEKNEELDKKGINNNFIRISVGLENIKDIILDLETSLKKIKK